MTGELHNARIVQREDGKFELLYDDDSGRVVNVGAFDDPNEAAAELERLRNESHPDDEGPRR